MKRSRIRLVVAGVIGVLLVAACNSVRSREAASSDSQMGTATYTLEVSGLKREYVVHVPRGYDKNQATPVVIMFHGGGGTVEHVMHETGWVAKADEAGFIGVFPQGIRKDPNRPPSFLRNPQTWNDGSSRLYAGEVNADDTGFARAMIADLKHHFNVDPKRIYVSGFSNGSSMAFRLGVELSDQIAAIAPVASSGLRLKDPHFGRAVSLIYIHGTADPRNPIEGGDVKNWGKVDWRPPLKDTVRHWAEVSGCRSRPRTLRDDSDGVRALDYDGCRGGAEVVFYTVEGMGHTWPGGTGSLPRFLVGNTSDKLNATDLIWDFFKRHPMN